MSFNKFSYSWTFTYIIIYCVVSLITGLYTSFINIYYLAPFKEIIPRFIETSIVSSICLSGAIAILSLFYFLIVQISPKKIINYAIMLLTFIFLAIWSYEGLDYNSSASGVYFYIYFFISIPLFLLFFIFPLIIVFLLEKTKKLPTIRYMIKSRPLIVTVLIYALICFVSFAAWAFMILTYN